MDASGGRRSRPAGSRPPAAAAGVGGRDPRESRNSARSRSSVSVNTSSNWSTTRTSSPASGRPDPPPRAPARPARGRRSRPRRVATRSSAASSSSIGCVPGSISEENPLGSGERPARIAGTNPARTTDDFPLPLGPTTARNRDPGPGCRIWEQVGDQPSRPKKSRRRPPRRAEAPCTGCARRPRFSCIRPPLGFVEEGGEQLVRAGHIGAERRLLDELLEERRQVVREQVVHERAELSDVVSGVGVGTDAHAEVAIGVPLAIEQHVGRVELAVRDPLRERTRSRSRSDRPQRSFPLESLASTRASEAPAFHVPARRRAGRALANSRRWGRCADARAPRPPAPPVRNGARKRGPRPDVHGRS